VEVLYQSILCYVASFLSSVVEYLQNYTGDRLNFGLAAEQAKSEGYKIEVGKHSSIIIT
jgi:dihydroxyacetone kinase